MSFPTNNAARPKLPTTDQTTICRNKTAQQRLPSFTIETNDSKKNKNQIQTKLSALSSNLHHCQFRLFDATRYYQVSGFREYIYDKLAPKNSPLWHPVLSQTDELHQRRMHAILWKAQEYIPLNWDIHPSETTASIPKSTPSGIYGCIQQANKGIPGKCPPQNIPLHAQTLYLLGSGIDWDPVNPEQTLDMPLHFMPAEYPRKHFLACPDTTANTLKHQERLPGEDSTLYDIRQLALQEFHATYQYARAIPYVSQIECVAGGSAIQTTRSWCHALKPDYANLLFDEHQCLPMQLVIPLAAAADAHTTSNITTNIIAYRPDNPHFNTEISLLPPNGMSITGDAYYSEDVHHDYGLNFYSNIRLCITIDINVFPRLFGTVETESIPPRIGTEAQRRRGKHLLPTTKNQTGTWKSLLIRKIKTRAMQVAKGSIEMSDYLEYLAASELKKRAYAIWAKTAHAKGHLSSKPHISGKWWKTSLVQQYHQLPEHYSSAKRNNSDSAAFKQTLPSSDDEDTVSCGNSITL